MEIKRLLKSLTARMTPVSALRRLSVASFRGINPVSVDNLTTLRCEIGVETCTVTPTI